LLGKEMIQIKKAPENYHVFFVCFKYGGQMGKQTFSDFDYLSFLKDLLLIDRTSASFYDPHMITKFLIKKSNEESTDRYNLIKLSDNLLVSNRQLDTGLRVLDTFLKALQIRKYLYI
jgi:hypothetical protein